MVRLSIAQFADASAKMCQHSGVKKTRLMMKIRAKGKDGKIVLKCTDDKTTLTTSTDDQRDLKVVEQIISDYVTRCTADAPAESLNTSNSNTSATKDGGKGKKKGKK